MNLEVFSEVGGLAKKAADIIIHELGGGTGPLGVATGSTPLPVYQELAKSQALNADLVTVALDEYLGIDPTNPSSFKQTLIDQLIDPCRLIRENLHVPPSSGAAEDITAFERMIVDIGPVKIQILGIGRNGHIAFNEPGSDPASTTRVVDLHPETIADNSDSFSGEFPKQAITQGIATIMSAEKLLLLAAGKSKAEAVASMFGVGNPTPATIIASHPDIHVLVDEEAASLIPRPR